MKRWEGQKSSKDRCKTNRVGKGGARGKEKELRKVTESEMEPADALSHDGKSRARSRETQKSRGGHRALIGG